MDMFLAVVIGFILIALSFGFHQLIWVVPQKTDGNIPKVLERNECNNASKGLTGEEKNFLRLFKIISGVAPKAVRELFDRYFPPPSLMFTLRKNEPRLKSLHYQKRLTAKQMSLLFPPVGQVSSAEFDVTLMICLLRNLTNISAPKAGFDKLPQPIEISEGADLARIKFYRNMMAHAEKDVLTIIEFNSIWKDLKEALVRLGGSKYQTECDSFNKMEINKDEMIELRQDVDDFKTEMTSQIHDVVSQTRNIKYEIGTIKQEFENLTIGQSKLESDVKEILDEKENVQRSLNVTRFEYQQLQQDYIETGLKLKDLASTTENIQHKMKDCNCQGTHQLEIEEWTESDQKFVKTKAVEFVVDKLQTCNVITVTGKPGMGKSATIHHVALGLSKTQGYVIIPCNSPADIKTHFKQSQLQLFVLDDLCGRYVINQNDVEQWVKNEASIKLILGKGRSKLLANCRLQIFKESQFKRIDLFFQSVCDLSSDRFCLSTEERLQIANQYLSNDMVDEIKNSLDKFEYLPLMCSLFTKRTNIDVQAFFNNPFAVYTEELNKLYDQCDKTKFCALFLCVVYDGNIPEAELSNTQNRNQLEQIFDDCGVNRGTSVYYLIEQLNSLIGTYIEKVGKVKGLDLSTSIKWNSLEPDYSIQHFYSTVHDKMFDFLCFYFGEKLQKAVIRHAHRRVVRERTQLNSLHEEHEEFTVMIREENEDFYFERILKEGECGNVRDLIYNSQMKFESYRLKLVSRLQSLDIDIIRKILTNKEYISEKSMMYMTCEGGYVDVLDFILGMVGKTEINKSGEKYPPLHGACHSGQYSVVKFLLDKGVDINQMDSDGGTPLLSACRSEKDNIVELLLTKYLNAKVNIQNKYGVTPLTIASLMGNYNIARFLIEEGADVNKGNQDGQSPLMKTCRKGHSGIVKLLIDHGADVNQTDHEGMTPLMSACQGGHKGIVQILLEQGADATISDNKGWTCLTFAIRLGYNSIAEILLNFEYKDFKIEGTSESSSNISIVTQLVNKTDNIGRSPLLWACEDAKSFIIAVLIEKGADINQSDKNAVTPLMKACECGRDDIVKILLERGADTTKIDNEGFNAKAWAEKEGKTNIISMLDNNNAVRKM